MARHGHPRQIAKLAKVQHVRKAAAEATLRLARDAEAAALETRERAEAAVAAATEDWLSCMGRAAFEPERARDLAARLVVREAEAGLSAASHDATCTQHLRRQDDWRLGAARVELADTMLADARRKAGLVREERRLAELSDRVTYDWMRR